jgi:hypothetical protein
LKRLFRKLHLIIGLISGLVVFILSITGCINSFEEELRSYFYADLFKAEKQNANLKIHTGKASGLLGQWVVFFPFKIVPVYLSPVS